MTVSTQAERTTTRSDGGMVLSLGARFDGGDEAAFNRADLIVSGIPHEGSSYRVLLFLNAPEADIETPCTPEHGFVGQFSIFGHGGCFGGVAHCDISGAPTDTSAGAVAADRPHPLTPKRKVVTITNSLKHILDAHGSIDSITFVPIRAAPKREDCGPAIGLFQFEEAMIQTYR